MSIIYDVAILTEHRYVSNPTETPGERNVLEEDTLVQRALERKGLRVTRVDWADKTVDWTAITFALFRSTWDYMLRLEEFSIWLEETQRLTQFINAPDIVRWNMDKHYLKDLATKGVNVPQAVYISRGDPKTLQEFLTAADWPEAVIKPTVSATATDTYRINRDTVSNFEATFRKAIQEKDMMMQPFLTSIVERGEVSVVVIDGKYSHSVLKVAKSGDFRVQDDFGGTVHPYTPTEEEMLFAEAAVAACSSMPLYARIDIANDNDGAITLMEIELIEPELWFRMKPDAADRLAEGLERILRAKTQTNYE